MISREDSVQTVKTIKKEDYEREIAQLKYCLEIGKEAYKQELARTETLKMRTENLVKYSSIFIAVANLVVSLVYKGALDVGMTSIIADIYTSLMVAIVICIILTLIAQRPISIEMFPDGVWMLEEIRSHQKKYTYENERIYEMILRYTNRTRTIKKNNDASLKLITISYILYIVSIILLTFLIVITVKI